MSQDLRPNRAINPSIMLELLSRTEQRILDSNDQHQLSKFKRLMTGGYFCICYVVSLRIPEGLLCDLSGLLEHHSNTRDYAIIPLLGKVKGEHHLRQHLMLCDLETDLAIKVKVWLERLITMHRHLGRSSGPVFLSEEGNQSSTSEMND